MKAGVGCESREGGGREVGMITRGVCMPCLTKARARSDVMSCDMRTRGNSSSRTPGSVSVYTCVYVRESESKSICVYMIV